MNYTIAVSKHESSNIVLSQSERGSKKAALAAKELAKEYPRPDYKVWVSWYRSSDGQHGYLNPGGDHAITGEAW